MSEATQTATATKPAKVRPREAPRPSDDITRAAWDRLNADYEAALDLLDEERDAHQKSRDRVKELEPLEARVKELEGFQVKARDMEAKAAFDKIADDLKIDPKFRDDVWKLAGFKPKGDEIKPEDVKSHLEGWIKDKPQYVGDGKPAPSKLPAGEGSTRGGKSPGFGDGDAKPKVTRAQLADYRWTTANQELLADASKYEIVMD